MPSMEGSTKGWKKFAQKDRTAAENFARAATENGVKRIIYLSRACHGKDATEPDINLSYNSHEKIEFIETYIR